MYKASCHSREYDPPEGWGWCYVDEALIDLCENTTPQVGPLPRYY